MRNSQILFSVARGLLAWILRWWIRDSHVPFSMASLDFFLSFLIYLRLYQRSACLLFAKGLCARSPRLSGLLPAGSVSSIRAQSLELFRQHSAAGQNHFFRYEDKKKKKDEGKILPMHQREREDKDNITMATEEWMWSERNRRRRRCECMTMTESKGYAAGIEEMGNKM